MYVAHTFMTTTIRVGLEETLGVVTKIVRDAVGVIVEAQTFICSCHAAIAIVKSLLQQSKSNRNEPKQKHHHVTRSRETK